MVKRLEIRMDDRLHKALRGLAFKTGESMNQLVVAAIRDSLNGKK